MNPYNIYPKQFRNEKIPIEKNRCFVIMPFKRECDSIYGDVKQILIDNGFICNRADEIFGSTPIIGKVLKEILSSHFIIADLTGQNANVFYELGIAHSFKEFNNIILISQNQEDIPIDVRHLNTIIYTTKNPRYLTSKILQAIEENRHQFDFFESLQKNSIISSIHDGRQPFVDIFSSAIGNELACVTAILNGKANLCSDNQIRKVLDLTQSLVYETAIEKNIATLNGLIKILSSLICKLTEYSYSREVAKHFLFENKLESYSLSYSDITSLQSKMAVHLGEMRVFQDIALTWIIGYFSKSKTATIDLNRYWLERFLLTSDDYEVHSAIVNSVLHENYYVREHMADLIGEKKLLVGRDVLIAQLAREENIYATASIITALGKLADREAYEPIVNWLEKNRDRVISTQHFFVLKHIGIALKRMRIDNEYSRKFESDFSEHLVLTAIF